MGLKEMGRGLWGVVIVRGQCTHLTQAMITKISLNRSRDFCWRGTALDQPGLKPRIKQELSGDTLFHLAFMTPPTSTLTLPLTHSLTSPHTTDSLNNPSQYNSNASAPPCLLWLHNLVTYSLSFHFVISSYSFLCRYISIMALLSLTTLWSQLSYSHFSHII